MELSKFVSGSIIQIIDGINEAQEHAKENNALINPTKMKRGKTFDLALNKPNGQHWQGEKIEFDIAVEVTDTDSSQGLISVYAGAINKTATEESKEVNSHISRIKFSVPVFLPEQDTGY